MNGDFSQGATGWTFTDTSFTVAGPTASSQVSYPGALARITGFNQTARGELLQSFGTSSVTELSYQFSFNSATRVEAYLFTGTNARFGVGVVPGASARVLVYTASGGGGVSVGGSFLIPTSTVSGNVRALLQGFTCTAYLDSTELGTVSLSAGQTLPAIDTIRITGTHDASGTGSVDVTNVIVKP